MQELRDRLKDLYKKKRVIGLSAVEAARLTEFLGDEDLKFRFFVGSLIQRNGNHTVPSLIQATQSAGEEARRSAIYLLGKIGRGRRGQKQLEIVEAILPALRDADPKVRRNAAIALGELRAPAGVERIAEAIVGEPFDWVRPSMILALGQIGGQESARVLAAIESGTPEDTEALTKARDRTSVATESELAPTGSFPQPRRIEMRVAPGLEPTLCDELKTTLGLKSHMLQNGAIAVEIEDLGSLDRVRTFSEWLIPIGERELADKSDGAVRLVGHDLLEKGMSDLVTLRGGAQGRVRYRIEVRGRETNHDSRRKLIGQWVRDLDKSFPNTTNSPSHYEAELRLQRAKTKLTLFVKLMGGQDKRFAYRVADVPAAMHPATAAGVARMARNTGRPSRVLDPFCGSGTMLFERSRSGRTATGLVGCDLSGNAITAARKNLSQFGPSDIEFRRGDVKTIVHEGRFDEVISNLPYGIRTGTHDQNLADYKALFDRMPEWLNSGASVTLVTQEIEMTKALFKASKKFRLYDVHRIDTGGLQPGVFVGVFSGKSKDKTNH
jgi:23S rRNA G2445 N2-methylase RlmL